MLAAPFSPRSAAVQDIGGEVRCVEVPPAWLERGGKGAGVNEHCLQTNSILSNSRTERSRSHVSNHSVFRAKWPLLEVTQVAQRPSACLVCAGGLEKPLNDASERC